MLLRLLFDLLRWVLRVFGGAEYLAHGITEAFGFGFAGNWWGW